MFDLSCMRSFELEGGIPVDAGCTNHLLIMGQQHKPGLKTAAAKMRKNFLTQLATAAIVLVAAFPFSNTAQALNIGNVVSQSKIGEPLRTQIELTGSGNEIIEDACLSLVAPDPDEEGARDFLTAAKLTVKTEEKRQFAVISSHRPYNDPFLRFKLQVRCAGVGNIVKSFTILPDFVDVLPIAAPVVSAEVKSVAASISTDVGKKDMASGASPSADQDRLSERRQAQSRSSKDRARPPKRDVSSQHAPTRRSPPARTARSNQGQAESFKLRLSGESIDVSRIGKISKEERSLLLARQKLLDADDQMASFLALQDQVKQLQAELGLVKLKLGQLGISSPAGTLSLAAAQLVPAPVASVQEAQPQLPQPASEATSPQPSEAAPDNVQDQQAQNKHPVKQRKPKIQRGPIIAGLLALLGLLLGLRYLMRIRAQSVGEKPVLKRPADIVPAAASRPAPAPATTTRIAQPGAKPAVKPAAAFKARTGMPAKAQTFAPHAVQKKADTIPAAASPAYERTQEELAEADSIIEEAELYAIHGHPDRAVLILKELIQQYTTKVEAWILLFSIYSSLKKVPEFEQAARDFISANQGSATWLEIQALGRSIDPNNVLYADFSMVGAGAAVAPQPILGKRVLLGDVLLAMGVLSIQDMEKCLAEFDPKIDGRFGGFLVKRNMITEADLEAALLQQQLNNEANTSQAGDTPEPKNGMLPDMALQLPEEDLQKMNKSPESGPPSGFKEGDI